MIADVEDAVLHAVGILVGYAVKHPHNAFDDVIDVSEIATHVAMVINIDRPASNDRLCEPERRHVRPPPRSVDREKS